MSTDQTTRPAWPAGLVAETPTSFDLAAFGRALTRGDLGRQLGCYAEEAEVRITTDFPTTAPRVVSGTRAISAWLLESASADPPSVGSRLVDGGGRVAFSQRWRSPDGSTLLAVSTAELQDGLITTQHTILLRGEDQGDGSLLPEAGPAERPEGRSVMLGP